MISLEYFQFSCVLVTHVFEILSKPCGSRSNTFFAMNTNLFQIIITMEIRMFSLPNTQWMKNKWMNAYKVCNWLYVSMRWNERIFEVEYNDFITKATVTYNRLQSKVVNLLLGTKAPIMLKQRYFSPKRLFNRRVVFCLSK